jgi:O-antigen ligase
MFIVLIQARKKIFFLSKFYNINYLILFFIFCIISGFWSTSPFYSFYRAFEVAILMTSCLFIAHSKLDTFDKYESWFLKQISLISIIGLVSLPIRRGNIQFSFDWFHNNSFTVSAAIVATYALASFFEPYYYKNRSGLMKKYLIISIIILIIGNSLASILGVVLAISIVFLFNLKLSTKQIFSFIAFFATIIILLKSDVFINEIILTNKSMDKLMTGSGRLYLFTIFFQMIIDKPFLGWGYGVMAREVGNYYSILLTTNTHNSFISILGSVGLLGFLLFLFSLYNIFVQAREYKKSKRGAHLAIYSVLIAILINSQSKGILGEHAYPETISIFFSLSYFFVIHRHNIWIQK